MHNIIKIENKQLQTTYYGYAVLLLVYFTPSFKTVQQDFLLFARLFIVRESALQSSFSHENQLLYIPPSFSSLGWLKINNKSDLLPCLKNLEYYNVIVDHFYTM